MKREFRLLKNYDFTKVINKKQNFANQSFVVYYQKNDQNKIRVGISISSKYGCAVERNKAKRQVREMVHDIFPTTLALDIVIIIRKGFSKNDFKKNFEELNRIYKKILEKVD